MKKILCLLFILSACEVNEQDETNLFPVLTVSDDEWASYEGRWLTKEGIIHFELSLKTGPVGLDSYYVLRESFSSDSLAHGTTSQGRYSTFYGSNDKEVGICLHNLDLYDHSVVLRYQKSPDMPEEMFFLTRGNSELLPSDDNFKPLTTDRRYTLHKRSKLFTVEGYLTVEDDSVSFFERNTYEHWRVTNLGEFDQLSELCKQLAKEKYEGIYLKALAYSVSDTLPGKNALAIKRLLNVGNDPD